jgi:hypothetical protein
VFFQVLFIPFDINYKKSIFYNLHQEVETGAEKTERKKTEWGGCTLLEPGCPSTPRRI